MSIGDIAHDATTAYCAVHEQTTSEFTCSRCGAFGCWACRSEEVEGQCKACAPTAIAGRYYPVPMPRFVAMLVLTFGLYGFYWFYRQWQHIKRYDRSDIWPLPRAVFSGIFFFALVNDLNARSMGRGLPQLTIFWPVLYLASNALGRLPEPMDLLSVFGLLALIPAARRIEAISPQSQVEANRPWRARHYVALVVGIGVWALVLFGAALPGDETTIGGPVEAYPY